MRFWKKKEPGDYIGRKEYKKAIEQLRKRLGSQPQSLPLRLSLADTLLLDGQRDEAIDEYYEVARLYQEQGFLVKAIAVYKKILKIDPHVKDMQTLLDNRYNLSNEVESTTSGSARRSRGSEVEVQLFKDLSSDEFKQIANSLSLRILKPDRVVVKEGDPGDAMFVVVRGSVRVLTRDTNGKEVELARLGEGEFFGEVALLTGKPRTATIVANTESELLELTKQDYDDIVQQYPHVKKVMEDFHLQRAYKTVEAMIQSFHEARREKKTGDGA